MGIFGSWGADDQEPFDPPTRKQLKFAERLKIKIPKNADMWEVSDLIDEALEAKRKSRRTVDDDDEIVIEWGTERGEIYSKPRPIRDAAKFVSNVIQTIIGVFLIFVIGLFVLALIVGWFSQPEETIEAPRRVETTSKVETPAPVEIEELEPQQPVEVAEPKLSPLDQWLTDNPEPPKPPTQEAREWNTTVGEFSVMGTLVMTDGETARIKRSDGKYANVPVAKLRAEDRIYAEEMGEIMVPYLDWMKARRAFDAPPESPVEDGETELDLKWETSEAQATPTHVLV